MNLTFLANETTTSQSPVTMIVMMVALFGLMYFLMIRPQKKKQKEEQQMRDNVEIGDEITSIGGICGRIVSIKEDTIIVETGADRNKMKMKKWSIQTNDTANERIMAERQAAKEAADKAKEEKKAAKSKKDD